MSARRLSRATLGVVAALLLATSARGGEAWKKEKPWQELLAMEVRTLTPLLRSALKEDYRRQAWYLAGRVAAADPKNAEATETLERWNDEQLQEGMDPKKAWLDKRTRTLEEVGNAYARFAEQLSGSGMPAEDYYPVIIRARQYGGTYGPLIQSMEQEGQIWAGTFGDPHKDDAQKVLGAIFDETTYPPEFDDDYLETKVRWPEARIAAWHGWRLTTDQLFPEAARLVATLAGAEALFTDWFGTTQRGVVEPTNVLVLSDAKTYDAVAAKMLKPLPKEFAGTSGWSMPWDRVLLVCWRDRTNGWIGEDAVLLFHAAGVLARRHLGADNRTGLTGRGSWLLDGLGGAFEGFVPGTKGEKGEIDPGKCWRLAVAKRLRADKALLPWEQLLEMDREKMDAAPKRTVKVAFRGAEFEAKDADVARCQATALVVGVMKADAGKGAKRLAKLLEEYMKRDGLPDLDKTLGWKKGRAFEEAEKAIDAAHGR